jgi:hypothetical protein
MKLRKVKLTLSQLTELLQGKGTPVALPADVELLDSKVDLFSQTVWLVIRSANFEDSPDGVEIPELNAVLTAQVKPAVAPVPSVAPVAVMPKTEPTVEVTSPDPRPLVPRPTQPPLSRYASKMENEFSPDQRKLLSFTVKDDSVIVKPVMFLKAEWEDINDVVRGLGGRWVKGDIISYWEIPLQ